MACYEYMPPLFVLKTVLIRPFNIVSRKHNFLLIHTWPSYQNLLSTIHLDSVLEKGYFNSVLNSSHSGSELILIKHLFDRKCQFLFFNFGCLITIYFSFLPSQWHSDLQHKLSSEA